MKEIDDLKKIFLNPSIDPEDRADNEKKLLEWEESVRDCESFAEWADHDVSRSIVRKARTSYVEMAVRLATDRKLTEQERGSLYAQQDACIWLLRMIDKENAKANLASIKEEIQRALIAST